MPNLEIWHELEANRQLLEPRSQLVSTFLIVCIFGLMVTTEQVPISINIIWLMMALCSRYWMRHLVAKFTTFLLDASPNTMTPAMTEVVEKYKQSWLINTLVWALTCYIFTRYFPPLKQTVGIYILIAYTCMALQRTLTHRVMMQQVTGIMICIQIINIFYNLVAKPNPENTPFFLFYYLFVLLFTWFCYG